jgi:lysophospholipase L1-like esterase
MRAARRVAAVAAAAMCLAALAAVAADASGPPQPAVYLALGDSVAAGIGASSSKTGYVAVLHDTLTDARACGGGRALGCRLSLVSMAVPGATTTSLIGRPGESSQLSDAVALLQARNSNRPPVDDVKLLTLTIGGNDVFGPVLHACAAAPGAESCQATIADRLALVAQNYDLILSALRTAAGGDTTIAVMTYYNPLPACELAPLSGLATRVLEGDGGLAAGLNDIIRRSAARPRHGVVVVETAGVIGVEDLVGGEDCLHPDDSGHADIAAAFAEAVTAEVIGPPGRR